MSATIESDENSHYPVLLNEVLSIISPQNGGTFIDCTLGQGGYTEKILEFPETKVIAFDRDSDSKSVAIKLKKKFKNRFEFHNRKFSDIGSIILPNKISGIIFDLGFSYNQIKNESKGLSFNHKGKLNMKMGHNKISAHEIVNTLPAKDLEQIFKYLGNDKNAKLISKKIIKKRNINKISTEDLVNIINSSKKNFTKKNKSTKIFQALRIFVNKEITELINGLINAYNILPIGGLIAVVTFHSIEDKIVKFFFKEYSEIKNSSRYLPKSDLVKKYFDLIKKKPIIPSSNELKINPPSRSAKLRFAFKLENGCDFKKFVNNFNYLKDIENLKIDV